MVLPILAILLAAGVVLLVRSTPATVVRADEHTRDPEPATT